MAKKILIVGDCPTLNTGYARVGRFVATTLQDNRYNVRFLPVNATVIDSTRKFNFKMDKFDPHDRYFNRRINDVLTAYKPSLVIVFGEFNYVGYIGNACRFLNIRSLYYMPVEGNGYPPKIVYLGGGHIDFQLTLQKFHYIVAYSEFGARNINNLLPGIVTETIPHQVDTKMFRPLDKNVCTELFFPHLVQDPEIGFDNTFIVGMVSRNQRRKGTDYFLKGLRLFIEQYQKDKKIISFMVTDPKDSQGYNLTDLVEKYNLKGHVALHPVTGGKEGPEDNHLCEIYNTFDVMLSPHRAEGFGCPLLEVSACGVRVLTTNYATPAEIGKGVFDYIEPFGMEPLISTNCEWAVLNPQDIADALGKIYNENNTKEVFHKGVELAKKYDNKLVEKNWINLLKDMDLTESSDIVSDETAFTGSTTEQIADDYLSSLE